MTKADIVNSIHEIIGFSKDDGKVLLDEFLKAFNNILLRDNKLKFRNFGSFKVQKKKSRIGRNPKTKEEFLIRSRNVLLFRPSRKFKKYFNEYVIQND